LFNEIVSFKIVVLGINPIKIKDPSAVNSSTSPVTLSFICNPLKFPSLSLVNAKDSLFKQVLMFLIDGNFSI